MVVIRWCSIATVGIWWRNGNARIAVIGQAEWTVGALSLITRINIVSVFSMSKAQVRINITHKHIMSEPDPLPTHIYKILDSCPPKPLPAILSLSELDAKDGFIHLSSGDQVPETAKLFFKDHAELWLLEIPLVPLNDGPGHVIWEGGRGCAHLYDASIGAAEVSRVTKVKRGSDQDWGQVLENGW